MTTLVFAGPEGDPVVQAVAAAMAQAQLSHLIVGLDPRARGDGAHEQRFRAAVSAARGPVIVGGFSLGARIAARLCPELAADGLLCLGYPFHQRGDPRATHGLEALTAVTVPTRVIQGTRDNHGTEAEVRSYGLPATVEVLWVGDANHRFVPRERSLHTEEEHLAAVLEAAVSFVASRPTAGR